MESIGYPADLTAAHKALHAGFAAELKALGDQPLYKTLDYFHEWLLRHIMTEDHKIQTYLRRHAGLDGPQTKP